MKHEFETLTVQELETVAGGLSFSVDFEKGITLDSKLISVAIKPGDILAGLKKTVSDALDSIGKLTSDLGQLFDFS